MQRPRPVIAEDKFVAIVSGLGIGGTGQVQHLLLLDWLKGLLDGDSDSSICRQVVRLIIAGADPNQFIK